MNENFLRAMSTLMSPQMLLASSEPYGDSVRLRRRKANEPRPGHLYLVYISFGESGLIVRYVEKDIDPAKLETEEDALIQDAKHEINLVGADFDLMIFEKATNFTIVLDEDDWDFYYPDPYDPEPSYAETHDPIIFTGAKTFVEDNVLISRAVSRNRSFYDLEPITKEVDGEDRKGIRCINHFTKNDQSDPVGAGDRIDYSFNIFLRVPFSTEPSAKKVTIIVDPDGQNRGPPAPSAREASQASSLGGSAPVRDVELA